MRHGIAPVSGGTAPINPSSLFFDFIYRGDRLDTMQDSLGGTAEVADLISLWGDVSGNGNDATEGTNYPTVQSDGMQAGTNIRMSIGTPISVTGVFEFWGVTTRAAGQIYFPVTRGISDGCLGTIYSDNNIYFITDLVSVASAAFNATGTFLYRMWRDGSNLIKAEGAGLGEVSLGTLAGTLSANLLFGRPGIDWTNSACRAKFIGLKTGSLLTTPQKNGLLSWFQSIYGVTL